MFDLVITSGGFDPLHIGHIEYLEKAKALTYTTHHICIVNSDEFLRNKKGFAFMSMQDRSYIVHSLKCVDEVFCSIDEDQTVCKSIEEIAKRFRKNPMCNKIYFAKGGDRFATEIPEKNICDSYGIIIVDGLGKKIRSSSEIVQNAKGDF